MEAINEVARGAGLAVFEDAAQAHGRPTAGRAGYASIAAGFTFYPGKNLGAFGDAGAVTSVDDALAAPHPDAPQLRVRE